MNSIEIASVTKDYGGGKGIFDISFSVKKGEVMGFLGPNGAGKTTTIRQLMGFIRPDRGTLHILGLPCFEKAAEIQKHIGYLPGEIAFMDDMTGTEFIRFVASLKGMKSLARAKELQDFFELDAGGKIKKMSKGMKQKIGLVCAFMQDTELYILDEPTSGLDPLMQNQFIELILKEKARGKTILMSSHIFEEVEKTCDRTAIIKDGRIVTVQNMDALQQKRRKSVTVRFANDQAAKDFAAVMTANAVGDSVAVTVSDMDAFLKTAAAYPVRDLSTRTQSLEELFLHFYGGDAQ